MVAERGGWVGVEYTAISSRVGLGLLVECVICGEGGRVRSGERVWVCAACWAMVVWEGYARTRDG